MSHAENREVEQRALLHSHALGDAERVDDLDAWFRAKGRDGKSNAVSKLPRAKRSYSGGAFAAAPIRVQCGSTSITISPGDRRSWFRGQEVLACVRIQRAYRGMLRRRLLRVAYRNLERKLMGGRDTPSLASLKETLFRDFRDRNTLACGAHQPWAQPQALAQPQPRPHLPRQVPEPTGVSDASFGATDDERASAEGSQACLMSPGHASVLMGEQRAALQLALALGATAAAATAAEEAAAAAAVAAGGAHAVREMCSRAQSDLAHTEIRFREVLSSVEARLRSASANVGSISTGELQGDAARVHIALRRAVPHLRDHLRRCRSEQQAAHCAASLQAELARAQAEHQAGFQRALNALQLQARELHNSVLKGDQRVPVSSTHGCTTPHTRALTSPKSTQVVRRHHTWGEVFPSARQAHEMPSVVSAVSKRAANRAGGTATPSARAMVAPASAASANPLAARGMRDCSDCNGGYSSNGDRHRSAGSRIRRASSWDSFDGLATGSSGSACGARRTSTRRVNRLSEHADRIARESLEGLEPDLNPERRLENHPLMQQLREGRALSPRAVSPTFWRRWLDATESGRLAIDYSSSASCHGASCNGAGCDGSKSSDLEAHPRAEWAQDAAGPSIRLPAPGVSRIVNSQLLRGCAFLDASTAVVSTTDASAHRALNVVSANAQKAFEGVSTNPFDSPTPKMRQHAPPGNEASAALGSCENYSYVATRTFGGGYKVSYARHSDGQHTSATSVAGARLKKSTNELREKRELERKRSQRIQPDAQRVFRLGDGTVQASSSTSLSSSGQSSVVQRGPDRLAVEPGMVRGWRQRIMPE